MNHHASRMFAILVVQWASSSHPTTRRVYVNRGSHTVVENLPRVDMGQWQNLVEFAKWGAKNYPAKHYFINIWNHGGGWHRVLVDGKNLKAQKSSGFQTQDISWDDFTGRKITTEELGTAMKEIAFELGQKIDIYGSDACLMAMAEVAAEVQDSVHYMVGSEEVEPGQGWPLPTSTWDWQDYQDRYRGLRFDQDTQWSRALEKIQTLISIKVSDFRRE